MLSVGPRYFDALGVACVRGRPFDVSDGTPGREVAIVNQRLAPCTSANAGSDRAADSTDRRHARSASEYDWATIVGVAPNVRQRSGSQDDPEPDPVVYIPHAQNPALVGLGVVLVRGRSNPAELMPVVRKEIFALDPDLLARQHPHDG